MKRLGIDLETYSSVDIKTAGTYAYVNSHDFEILLFGYAFDDDPVQVVSLVEGEELPADVLQALFSQGVLKTAYNANFEMTCLAKYFKRPMILNQWACTSVLALTLGLPGYLDGVAKALGFPEEKQKMFEGKRLITYFCKPCNPSKINEGRTRNLPEHDAEKWAKFKEYNAQDVIVEREVLHKCEKYRPNAFEYALWQFDQRMNNKGVMLDIPFIGNAIILDGIAKEKATEELKAMTGLDNPASVMQFKSWLENQLNTKIESIDKAHMGELLKANIPAEVVKAIRLKQLISKTSVKKYAAMLNSVCDDGRIHGVLQFYGANRTGRWAGRLVQLHNLPQNHLADLDDARNLVKAGDHDMVEMLYGNVPNVLSQLIRTALVASPGRRFIVADFSAIEARVIAWLADEKWRQEIFATTGKIYEASASKMFHIPIEEITKLNPARQKGKVAELALGYQGGPGALVTMGALNMGLEESELQGIVDKWRAASPNIVKFWHDVDALAKEAITQKRTTTYKHGLAFCAEKGMLFIRLPSGRRIAYVRPRMGTNRFGGSTITYEGLNQETKKWVRLETYGGKLVENIVQATARDCLAAAMLRLDATGYQILFHVHDEVIIEAPLGEGSCEEVVQIMSQNEPWMQGLLLTADGYETPYYRKD
jgi:DNA polymerase I - 3''-5'' exonuclease and polymerase domains